MPEFHIADFENGGHTDSSIDNEYGQPGYGMDPFVTQNDYEIYTNNQNDEGTLTDNGQIYYNTVTYKCPESYILNKLQNICEPCAPSCKNCLLPYDENSCTECYEDGESHLNLL